MNWFQDISMCIDSRQSIQLCPYHMGVISSIVRSAFTNMKSCIGKNVRLCALKYAIGEGEFECWKFSEEFFVQRFIYGLPLEVFVW